MKPVRYPYNRCLAAERWAAGVAVVMGAVALALGVYLAVSLLTGPADKATPISADGQRR